jgi:hypothetical protein
MLKIARVCLDGAEKVSVCYRDKQESFGYTPHNSLNNRERLRPRTERESFQFDSRQVIPREFVL